MKYVVAIRSNHQAWIAQEQVTYSDWQTFARIFSNGKEQTYYIQEIICTGCDDIRYWKVTKDILMERKNTTWYLMTNLSGEIQQSVGNTYGFRNWIEYAIKQAKNELGWADFRVTNYQQIEKWWEMVYCAYLMVSWHTIQRDIDTKDENRNPTISPTTGPEPEVFNQHTWWDFHSGWKSTLNNLRLVIQPYVLFNFLKPWLKVFDVPDLETAFSSLLDNLNQFSGYVVFNSG